MNKNHLIRIALHSLYNERIRGKSKEKGYDKSVLNWIKLFNKMTSR